MFATRRIVTVLLSLACASNAWNFALADTVLPTENDLKGIKNICGGGSNEALSLEAKVDTAISDWKKMSANANMEVAKKDLIGFLSVNKNDSNVTPLMEAFYGCVFKLTLIFLDQHNSQPYPISEIGNSQTLMRSSYPSDEAMMTSGCKQAEEEAIKSLSGKCGDRLFIANGTSSKSTCTKSGNSPGIYSVNIQGECRTRR